MGDPVVFDLIKPQGTWQWHAWSREGFWYIRYRWGELLVDHAPNINAWQTGDWRLFEVARVQIGDPMDGAMSTLDMLAELRRLGVLADG